MGVSRAGVEAGWCAWDQWVDCNVVRVMSTYMYRENGNERRREFGERQEEGRKMKERNAG